MYTRSIHTWIFLLYISLILFFSLIPGDDFILLNSLWKYDKLVHFFEYFGMGILLVNAIKIKPISKMKWRYIMIFIILFPIIDESLQFFTPRRIPDVFDAIADMIGGSIGAYLRRYL